MGLEEQAPEAGRCARGDTVDRGDRHLSSIALLMSHFQRGVGGQLGNLPLRQELNASYKDDSKIDQKNIHSPLS